MAETIGLVPSLNVKDNMIQGIVVLVGTLLCAVLGLVYGGGAQAALIGALVGLVVSGVLSGGVLMVMGLLRNAKKA